MSTSATTIFTAGDTLDRIDANTASLAQLAPDVAGFIARVTDLTQQSTAAAGSVQAQIAVLQQQFQFILQLLQAIIMQMATTAQQQQLLQALQEIYALLTTDAPRTLGIDTSVFAARPQPTPSRAGP